ncbi:MAG: T9SS type A sorting domain-containing protein [Bacteroidales bacterium]|nr:T9SS type A sorting domain-containing protein [Bacteroidales bacterium]
MKKYTLINLLLFVVLCSQAQYVNWIRSYGGAGMQRAWDLETDAQGNAVVCGQFEGSLQLGDFTLNSNGLADVFAASVNAQGQYNWAYSFGGADDDIAIDITVDESGNAYVGGYYTGSVTFLGEEISAAAWGAFIIKIDQNGNPLWMHHPSCPASAIVHGMDYHDGAIYYTGWYQDGIAISDELELDCYGSSDILACCIDTDGEVQWARNFGGEEVDYGYKLQTDDLGNSYIVGVTGQGAAFDGLTVENSGTYIVKINHQGEVTHFKNGIHAVGPYSLAVDGDGSVAFGGYFSGSVEINGESYQAYEETKDALFMKLNTDLSFSFVNHYSGNGDAKPRIPAFDNQGNVFFLGSFSGEFTIEDQSHNAAMSDVFLIKFDTQGNHLWHSCSVGDDLALGYGLAISGQEQIFFCGFHKGMMSFNGIEASSAGNADMNLFIAHSSTTVDLSDVKENSLKVYPNPAQGKFYLTLDEFQGQNIEYFISDVKGRFLFQKQITVSGDLSLDISHLKSGLYFVGIKTQDQMLRASVVVH